MYQMYIQLLPAMRMLLNSKIGDHCVLSYIEVSDREIPDNVVLHGLKQRDGSFVVRIFGIGDNPKENKLFGRDLDELEQKLGVRLWENSAHSLWEANLYAEADNIQDGVDAALNLYRIVNDESAADIEQWRNAEKKSLCSGFNAADPDAIIAWNRRMEDLVAMDEITKAIRHTLIEQIFSSIEEMIDGRLVCGAGGGGFLQVILKKGITREDVEKRLNEVFMDSLVGVADCKLVW